MDSFTWKKMKPIVMKINKYSKYVNIENSIPFMYENMCCR